MLLLLFFLFFFQFELWLLSSLLPTKSTKKVCSWCHVHFCHTRHQPCLWHHRFGQIGSTHGCVFAIFRRQFLTNYNMTWSKQLLLVYYSFSFFLFIIPFILKGPILLLSLGSPLPFNTFARCVCVCERPQPCGAAVKAELLGFCYHLCWLLNARHITVLRLLSWWRRLWDCL